ITLQLWKGDFIRNKLVIMCFLSVTIITIGYGEYLTTLEQEKLIEQKESKIFPFVSNFETDLFDTISLLEITAKESSVTNIPFSDQIDPIFHGIREDSDIEKRTIANAILLNKENLDAVFFTMPNGDMYLVEPYQYQADLATNNFAHRDWYIGVTSAKSTYTSEVFQPQGKKEITVAIVTPVKSESSEIIGIWGGLVNLASWEKRFNEINFVENAKTIIVDHKGNRVIDSEHPSLDTIESHLYLQSVRNALAQNSGIMVETVDGVRSLVVYTPITVGTHTWAAIITEPHDQAFSAINFIRLLYIGIVVSIAGVMATWFLLPKKLSTTKEWWFLPQKISQIEQDVVESQPAIRSALNKKVYFVIIPLLLSSTLGVGLMQNQHPDETTNLKGSFLIQNLRGDTVDTWINWKIPKGDTFHIHVVNSPEVTTERMQTISDAIYSKESVIIDDSLLHKGSPGSTSTYYKGWFGAIESVSGINTRFAIPIALHTTITDKGEGHITIRLTKLQNSDGYSAYTKSFVDDENHQILKSVITVYDVDSLSDDQLATIMRHELGHGLGLAHSTAPEDLMAPEITTPYPYISECDIAALVGLYNGNQNSQVVCEK
ncbi:MAG TPA: matrixin family metalloprotease, partial [Candidatus Nitrosotenuis sp.]